METYKISQQRNDYQRIEKAILFIEDHFKSQPTLDEIAAAVDLSKYHFDRLFKRWAGISPIQFLHFMTLDYTKEKLAEAKSLLDTSLEAGLSGPSRLHDLFVTFEAMTPGDFKRKGDGLRIDYGFSVSPFGDCLLAATERGICYLAFVEPQNRTAALNRLYERWPKALFTERVQSVRQITRSLFGEKRQRPSDPFHLHLKGTNFQIRVWQALLNIPESLLVSYQDLAGYIGQPKAVRAVASTVAINPVAYLIPCHRVIAKSGEIHRYRWGTARKKALIGWEAAKNQ